MLCNIVVHVGHGNAGATNVAAVVASSKDHLTGRSSAAPRGNVGVTDVVTVVASNKDKFTVKSGTAKRGNARVTDMAPVIASDSDKDKFTMRFGTATRGNTGVTNVAPVVASNKNKFTVRPDALARSRGNARVTDEHLLQPQTRTSSQSRPAVLRGQCKSDQRGSYCGSNKNRLPSGTVPLASQPLLQEPPSNGYGYCPYAEGSPPVKATAILSVVAHSSRCTAAATYYYFPPFQHMFSEEDPTNAYTIL